MSLLRKALLILSVSRLHIALVGATGSLTFGYLITGDVQYRLAVVALMDWFLVNFFNKIYDYREDAANGIAHASFFADARNRKISFRILWAVLIASIFICPLRGVLAFRSFFHTLGFIYNVPMLPAATGMTKTRRLKDLYAFKNAASTLGFLVTLFGFPLSCLADLANKDHFKEEFDVDVSAFAGNNWALLQAMPNVFWFRVAVMLLYFTPFEHAFEIIYDIRDWVGDKKEGIQSYPVVHGRAWACRLVLILDAVSSVIMLIGLMAGLVQWKQGVLILGPIIRFAGFYFWSKNVDSITENNVQKMTWFFVVSQCGFILWNKVGLPTTADFIFGDLDNPIKIVVMAMVTIFFVTYGWTVQWFGTRKWLLGYLLIAVSGGICENTCILWYKFYNYNMDIWYAYVGVMPLEVTLIWPQVIFCSYRLWRENFNLQGIKLALIGGFEVFQLAFFVEICCVSRGFWWWTKSNIAGVPVIGIIGWGVFGVTAHMALESLSRGKWWHALFLPITSMVVVHATLVVCWNLLGFKAISEYDVPLETAGPMMACIMVAQTILQIVLGLKSYGAISVIQEAPRQLAAIALGYTMFAGNPKPSIYLTMLPASVSLAYFSMLNIGWPQHLWELKQKEDAEAAAVPSSSARPSLAELIIKSSPSAARRSSSNAKPRESTKVVAIPKAASKPTPKETKSKSPSANSPSTRRSSSSKPQTTPRKKN